MTTNELIFMYNILGLVWMAYIWSRDYKELKESLIEVLKEYGVNTEGTVKPIMQFWFIVTILIWPIIIIHDEIYLNIKDRFLK